MRMIPFQKRAPWKLRNTCTMADTMRELLAFDCLGCTSPCAAEKKKKEKKTRSTPIVYCVTCTFRGVGWRTLAPWLRVLVVLSLFLLGGLPVFFSQFIHLPLFRACAPVRVTEQNFSRGLPKEMLSHKKKKKTELTMVCLS